MTVFDTMMARADVVVDDVFAEAFAFQPMREIVNGDPVADATRAAIPVLAGVFADAADFMQAAGQGGRSYDAGQRVSSETMLSIRDSEAPASIRRFDRFIRARTGTVYEVTATRPDDLGRRVVSLVERRP